VNPITIFFAGMGCGVILTITLFFCVTFDD
jgi:hypothetical protein